MPEDRGRHEHVGTWTCVEGNPDDRRDRTLQRVEPEDQRSPLAPEHPGDVRRARVARARGQDVDPTGSSDHHRAWERAQQVGEGNKRECNGDPPTLRQLELWYW